MIPIAKMLWCLPLPSRTLNHSHALSTWKFRNVRIFWFWFFETKVTFVNASGYCFPLFASLSLPIPPSSFPTTPPLPPHSTPLATTPHKENDKDNKRKFERIDIFGGVQRARERMGRARMGNLEAQTVCEALGLDAQNLSAYEEDKEGKGHKEDAQSQDMQMDQKNNAAEYLIIQNKLHQSKLSRFFASSSSSSKCT